MSSLIRHFFSHCVSNSSADPGALLWNNNPNPIISPHFHFFHHRLSHRPQSCTTATCAGWFPAFILVPPHCILYSAEWAFHNFNHVHTAMIKIKCFSMGGKNFIWIISLLAQYAQWLLILLRMKSKFFIKLYKAQYHSAKWGSLTVSPAPSTWCPCSWNSLSSEELASVPASGLYSVSLTWNGLSPKYVPDSPLISFRFMPN